jgi:hypothetical protein
MGVPQRGQSRDLHSPHAQPMKVPIGTTRRNQPAGSPSGIGNKYFHSTYIIVDMKTHVINLMNIIFMVVRSMMLTPEIGRGHPH